jgi:hypothetical protein
MEQIHGGTMYKLSRDGYLVDLYMVTVFEHKHVTLVNLNWGNMMSDPVNVGDSEITQEHINKLASYFLNKRGYKLERLANIKITYDVIPDRPVIKGEYTLLRGGKR